MWPGAFLSVDMDKCLPPIILDDYILAMGDSTSLSVTMRWVVDLLMHIIYEEIYLINKIK